MSDPQEEWVILLLTADDRGQPLPTQLWDGEGWTPDLEKAKLLPTYGDAFHYQWNDKVAESAKKATPNVKRRVLRCFSAPAYRKYLAEARAYGSKIA